MLRTHNERSMTYKFFNQLQLLISLNVCVTSAINLKHESYVYYAKGKDEN
jgi:hypothetical protein